MFGLKSIKKAILQAVEQSRDGDADVSRRNVIKKAIQQTVEQFDGSDPAVSFHFFDFFDGTAEAASGNLAVWYLFKTDSELETARKNGLCQKIEEATIRNLMDSGYPAEAFAERRVSTPANITFVDASEQQRQMVHSMLTCPRASISFTTEEDIENKTNGDYYMYFK